MSETKFEKFCRWCGYCNALIDGVFKAVVIIACFCFIFRKG